MPILQTIGLRKEFGSLVAVDGLDLVIEPGEVFGLLGPNGAGKSTAIKMLTTLLPPTSGRAAVAGLDIVRHAPEVRRLIGYVPQMISADGQLTGYENLLVFARLYEIPRAERERRIRESLALMGLEEAAGRVVRQYLGGMIRRLEIAQSMLHRPRLVYLDEPTIGLDPLAREAVWNHLSRLRAEYGTTIFLTTHYMEEADSLCGRIAIMHRGKVAAFGTPARLKASIGRADATLGDVFAHYAGEGIEVEGGYRDASRTRRTVRRLG